MIEAVCKITLQHLNVFIIKATLRESKRNIVHQDYTSTKPALYLTPTDVAKRLMVLKKVYRWKQRQKKEPALSGLVLKESVLQKKVLFALKVIL